MDKLLKKQKILYKLYYNIKQPSSFGSIQKLYKNAVKIDKSITKNDVINWLKSQKTYTLHKLPTKNFQRNPMVSLHVDQWWQSDLADMSLLAKFNKGFKYLLVSIDVLSKFGWIIPIKNKKPESVIKAFKTILRSSSRKPEYLYTDAGKEYVNSKFNNFLKLHDIKHVIARNTETKAAIAERWIRTIKEKIYKYLTAYNTNFYINKLKLIVNGYNNTVYSRTKYVPSKVNSLNEQAVFKNLYKNIESSKKSKIKSGNTVRLQKLKKTFEKGHKTNWTNEIFLIEKILKTKPFKRFTVKDKTGEELEGTFYEKELQTVDEKLN